MSEEEPETKIKVGDPMWTRTGRLCTITAVHGSHVRYMMDGEKNEQGPVKASTMRPLASTDARMALEGLGAFELDIFMETCGLTEARPWGAAVGAAMEVLQHRLLTNQHGALTSLGERARLVLLASMGSEKILDECQRLLFAQKQAMKTAEGAWADAASAEREQRIDEEKIRHDERMRCADMLEKRWTANGAALGREGQAAIALLRDPHDTSPIIYSGAAVTGVTSRSFAIIRRISDGKAELSVDLTGKSVRDATKIILGLLRIMDARVYQLDDSEIRP